MNGSIRRRVKWLTIYSGCQKNVPIAERFFATTLMPPSFFRNINMTSGINGQIAGPSIKKGRAETALPIMHSMAFDHLYKESSLKQQLINLVFWPFSKISPVNLMFLKVALFPFIVTVPDSMAQSSSSSSHSSLGFPIRLKLLPFTVK
jgi:hypothetical protein